MFFSQIGRTEEGTEDDNDNAEVFDFLKGITSDILHRFT